MTSARRPGEHEYRRDGVLLRFFNIERGEAIDRLFEVERPAVDTDPA